MILQQDFAADFDLLTAGLARRYRGEPYAFIRFADGETAIMRGDPHEAISDGWTWPAGGMLGSHPNLRCAQLLDTLDANLPGFYQGLTAHEHHPDCHDWLLENSGTPRERISFAEVFIFRNYRRFRMLDLSRCTIVTPGGHVTVPADAVLTGWDHRHVVDYLIDNVRNPILVSAGPVANVIVHDYWLRCPDARKQVILDVGSAIDEKTKEGGRRTRRYQYPWLRIARFAPRFWPCEEK